MDKVNVNGKDAHDVFKSLRGRTPALKNRKNPSLMDQIPWNFCKWIVNLDGKIEMYMNPTVAYHNCYRLVEYLCKTDNKGSKQIEE